MKKMTDRFLLGAISGLGGNLAKMAVESVFVRMGISTETGAQKAAGIFLPKKDVSTPMGRAVGHIADNMIAAGLGVTCVYWATLMGKDNYLVKGAGLGAAEWTGLYGVMSKFGATSVFPTRPQDALIGFLSHLIFGAAKMTLVVRLGDSRLFKPGNLSEEIGHPEKPQIKMNPGVFRPSEARTGASLRRAVE